MTSSSRQHSLEKPTSVNNLLEDSTRRALKLFPACDPHYVCLVVATRKQENGLSSSAAQQRTNIYVTRNPLELVDRLNKGLPLSEAHGLDLSLGISRLLPPIADTPKPDDENNPPSPPLPLLFPLQPPPPVSAAPPVTLLIPRDEWPRLMDTPREAWFHRAMTAVIGMPEIMHLIRSMDRHERELEHVLMHIAFMQQELALTETCTPQPTERVCNASALQEMVVARRSDTERKRRRRQKQQQQEAAVKRSRLEEEQEQQHHAPVVVEDGAEKQNLGMVIGPLWTLEAAKHLGMIWSIWSRGSIPRSALGEVLAEKHQLNMYANLPVIFEEDEHFKHHVLRQTSSGELWLVERSKLGTLDRVLVS
jgi:hypothetical protein